jgi:hypothetical protein
MDAIGKIEEKAKARGKKMVLLQGTEEPGRLP